MSAKNKKKGELSSPSTSQGAASNGAVIHQQGNQIAAVKPSTPVPSVRGKGPTCQNLDQLVTITVGLNEDEETFQIYEGLLCFYSDYFRSAFKGSFSESETKSLLLEDVEVETFRMFQSWLLFGKISDTEGNISLAVGFHDLVSIWLFADAYLVPLLKNEAIDTLLEKMVKRKRYPLILNAVYENTPARSPLRRLFVDFINESKSRVNHHFAKPEYRRFLPDDFLLDLVSASPSRPTRITPAQFYDQRACRYHDHTSDGKFHW